MAHDTDENSFWRKLCYFMEEQFLMGCSIGHGGTENDKGNGLLTQHAYGILRCATTRVSKTRLVQLRNPWGMKEWNGRWVWKYFWICVAIHFFSHFIIISV